jgi:Tol biopolymer transport system component
MNKGFPVWRLLVAGCGAVCLGSCDASSPGAGVASLGQVPQSAEIIFHRDGLIYAMDRSGRGLIPITFSPRRHWEHVAVSYGRRYVVANEQLPNPEGDPGGRSRLWLIDLARGTETRLVPHFVTAGNGGVDWDPDGFIYFAGKETNPVIDPKTREDFLRNAGANDLFRIRPDGSGLQKVLDTPDRGEADISVSADGTMIAFVSQLVRAEPPRTEIWVARADGSQPRRVYAAGQVGVASAHDPELSPDNSQLVFSMVNSGVPPNFSRRPGANTAHDLYRINADGTGLARLTRPGPISIIPDWKDDTILYLELNEADHYTGISLVRATGTDQEPTRIANGANVAKWIP